MDSPTPRNKTETLAWIQQEFKATKTVKVNEVIGHETHLEPNPALGVCEGTFHPTTADGQHIIVEEAVYGEVEKEVRDQERVERAASLLVEMVLQDETLIREAKSIMPCNDLFQPHWQEIYDCAVEKQTRRIAAWKLGRAPLQVAVLWISAFLFLLFHVIRAAAWVLFGIVFYSGLIYFLWPESRLGRWISTRAGEIWEFLKGFF